MKPAIMELGGHAPVIVCGDADPDRAAATSVAGNSRNAGQVCVSPTRFFVEDAIHDRFAEAFGAGAAKVTIGNGLDPATQMGPLANHRRVEAMERLVADAVGKGARLLAAAPGWATAAASSRSPCWPTCRTMRWRCMRNPSARSP